LWVSCQKLYCTMENIFMNANKIVKIKALV